MYEDGCVFEKGSVLRVGFTFHVAKVKIRTQILSLTESMRCCLFLLYVDKQMFLFSVTPPHKFSNMNVISPLLHV